MQPQQQLHWGTYARGAYLARVPFFLSHVHTFPPPLSLLFSRSLYISLRSPLTERHNTSSLSKLC